MDGFNSGTSSHDGKRTHILAIVLATFFGVARACTLPIEEQILPTSFSPSQTPSVSFTASPTSTASPLSRTVTPTIPAPAVTPTTPDDLPTPDGNGEGGLADSNLALVHINLNAHPPTALLLRIRNYGPSDFEGTVETVCAGGGTLRSAAICSTCPPRDPLDYRGSERMDIPVALITWTFSAELDRTLNPFDYNYLITCTIAAVRDPDPSNNSHTFAYP